MSEYYCFDKDEYYIAIVSLGSVVAKYKVLGADAAGEAWDAACKFMKAIGAYGYLTDANNDVVLEIYGGD